MAKLTVLHFPDERLRKKAEPVTEITSEIKQIIADMTETMYAEEGIGLAATQVNIHKQIVIIDISEERNQLQVLINPVIASKNGSIDFEEGCLSVPEYRAMVSRAETLVLKALNHEGKPIEIAANGLLAICIQHELDHLNGTLFIDYLSPLKRQRLQQKLAKLAKREAQSVQ